jgi:hypothetical protein
MMDQHQKKQWDQSFHSISFHKNTIFFHLFLLKFAEEIAAFAEYRSESKGFGLIVGKSAGSVY